MSETELIILAVAAILSSAVTAVAGAGGGLILLIVILQFVDPLIAVPVHAVIQLFSNGTRAITLRASANRSLLGSYVWPVLPLTVVGYFIADAIPRAGGRAVIGGLALVAIWWPGATRWLVPKPGRGTRFAIVGAISGLAMPTIGATGPLLAPAFKAATRSPVEFIGTFALAQIFNHTAKIFVFGIAGLAWSDHYTMITVGVLGVVVGTRIGLRWLNRIDQGVLDWVFKAAVTLGGGRLIVGGLF